jgi:hypothetical protein
MVSRNTIPSLKELGIKKKYSLFSISLFLAAKPKECVSPRLIQMSSVAIPKSEKGSNLMKNRTERKKCATSACHRKDKTEQLMRQHYSVKNPTRDKGRYGGWGVRRSAHRQVGPRTHARVKQSRRREAAHKEHNVG